MKIPNSTMPTPTRKANIATKLPMGIAYVASADPAKMNSKPDSFTRSVWYEDAPAL